MICVPPPRVLYAAPELALYTPSRWDARRVLRVRFLDGDAGTQARIRAIEAGPDGWNSASAMQFRFVESGDAEIRVTLAEGASWSHIGMGCLGVPAGLPTMQLGWAWRSDDDELRRVWLHEAAHALGVLHEQDSELAVGSLPWDMDGIARWCEAHDVPLATWREQWTLHPTPPSVLDHDWYDPESISAYYIPAEWMLDRIARGGANRLSAHDRRRMAFWYGLPSDPPQTKPDEETVWLPIIGSG